VAGWGVVRQGLRETLECWAAEAPSPDAPRRLPLEPPQEPPYYVLEVQPTITFPSGGLAVNTDGMVLDRDGETVPGLFAVGADAGGLQDGRYAGGPSLGAVFGRRAADAALGAAATKVPDEGGGQGET
jgi:succinate dehydrogenase/fumarate reductase flavoprotein subunit